MKEKLMNKRLWILIPLAVWGVLAAFGPGRPSWSVSAPSDVAAIGSYRQIPGVTDEEIAAIEALKAGRESFSYGMLRTTEAFRKPDGTGAGFAVLFCGLLSDLFDIPFVVDWQTWDTLKPAFDSRSVDFTGELTPTPERMSAYHMTAPLTQRTLKAYFNHETSVTIEKEDDLNGLTIGFLADTVTEQAVRSQYPTLKFEAGEVASLPQAAEKLRSREIDAFVVDATTVVTFAEYGFISSADVFPFVYTPVSMATANPELAPVISVVDKYIKAGGGAEIDELYAAGEHEYARYRFTLILSAEESVWLNSLAAQGEKVPIVLEGGNYPLSFYNTNDGEYQGIVPDLLAAISHITGLQYEILSNRDTSWEAILEMLATGRASLVSELLYTEERKDNFLWARNPNFTSRYALLSKSGYPSLKMHHVAHVAVGAIDGGAAAEKYARWFPSNNNVTLYATEKEALDALEKDEIDLFMTSEQILLAQVNYREKPGYKVNIVLPESAESSFGFNKNERILCAVIDKAQSLVKQEEIVRDWTSRVYDYSRKMAEERSKALSAIAVILCAAFVGAMFALSVYIRKNRLITRQASLLAALYNSSPDIILSKDINGRYTSCNDAFKTFVERPESEIIGKSASDLFRNRDDLVTLFTDSDRAILSGEEAVVKVEQWFERSDGSRQLFELIKFPIHEKDRRAGLIVLSRDVTQYRQAMDAAMETSRSKSAFLAKMSHEIRTPMNAIIGMTELALREKNIDAVLEKAMIVRQSGLHLMSIINDILDFSKIERGMLQILPHDYLLSSLVNDIVSITRMRVDDARIKFVVNLDSRLPDSLIGDDVKLRQVLLNLLSNAVKYTDAGFVSLTINGEAADDDSVTLIMEVMDSGRGIKPEDIGYIFDEYTQSDQEHNKHIEGTGLGLTIARSIVEAMGGTIGVHSEYGKGSTFTVKIPQKIRKPGRLASVEKAGEKSVLLLERNSIYATSMMFAVNNLGAFCTLAPNETDLLAALSEREYDFVFLPFPVYEKNKDLVVRSGSNAEVVVLTGFGEAVFDGNARLLSRPVHCLSVANLLNGEVGSFTYRTNWPGAAEFTAPDARILIVDDVNTNLKVAEGLMAPYMMRIDVCRSGEAAIDAVQNERYDLLLMDHKMPGMDGVEAVRRIRALGGEDAYFRDVPIIALTANAIAGIHEMFLAGGFNDYVPKPIDTARLNRVLRKWIPKDLQRGPVRIYDAARSAEPLSGRDALLIEGIDVDLGILRSGGTAELFQETLTVFLIDAAEKSAGLKAGFEAGEKSSYVIYAHALKSALANIGATQLSEAALALESAGRQGDLYLIETRTPEFLADLDRLLSGIRRALEHGRGEPPLNLIRGALDRRGGGETLLQQIRNTLRLGGRDDKDTRLTAGAIEAVLAELREAIAAMDADEMDRIMKNLRQLPLDDQTAVVANAISEKILRAEFDEATVLTARLMESESSS